MPETTVTQQIILKNDYLDTWIEAFLIDRKAQNLKPRSIDFYREKLFAFSRFCESQAITRISQITANDIRQFMLSLEAAGHNPGGSHTFYRGIKAFLRWYEFEEDPDGWKNPIKKVKGPKLSEEPLDPIPLSIFQALLKICNNREFTGIRDRALLLCLLDTGARATEFLDINLDDLDLPAGNILIRAGKGGKPRHVFIGREARRAVRRYLRQRNDDDQALWVTDEGERSGYDCLRAILARRSKQAGVEYYSPHAYRRAFALTCLRNGMDIFTLQKLMGHASLAVLRRYLKQMDYDLAEVHQRTSPVDRMQKRD